MAPAHTHATPASLPFASALCRSGHTHGQQQNHFTLDDPKSTPTSLATQRSQLPARASCRSAIDAETRHSARTYFPRVQSAVCFTHSSTDRRSQKHATKATVIAQALATSVGVCMDPLPTRAGRQPQPVPSCQFIGSSTEKRKRPIPDALIPTGSTNTLVASRHSSAHPGMLKSDVELSASNATIPAHMSAPPEKTQITNNTLHMSSEHHSNTPRHAKQKYSSLHAPPHTIT
ncbi:hypothetical protein TcCL_Unassigned00237 [Trypanosoma cruzi]|nr:hypothetical protein TcCL_Unassigned00237 [Trypanosoma cruzi]